MIVLSPSAPLTTPSRRSRIDGARTGVVLLDPVRGKRQEIVDAIDDKSDRRAAIDHDHPRRLVQRRVREIEQAPQADDRQHHAAQVGEAQKASRCQRHVREGRQPDDLADIVESESEQVIRDPKDDADARRSRSR